MAHRCTQIYLYALRIMIFMYEKNIAQFEIMICGLLYPRVLWPVSKFNVIKMIKQKFRNNTVFMLCKVSFSGKVSFSTFDTKFKHDNIVLLTITQKLTISFLHFLRYVFCEITSYKQLNDFLFQNECEFVLQLNVVNR